MLRQMMIRRPPPPAHELACGSDWVVQRDGRGPACACAWSSPAAPAIAVRTRQRALAACLPALPQWSAIRLLSCSSTLDSSSHDSVLGSSFLRIAKRKTRVAICVRGAACSLPRSAGRYQARSVTTAYLTRVGRVRSHRASINRETFSH
jgi:hypothetical protein